MAINKNNSNKRNRLKDFGFLASPPCNTNQRLTSSCMSYLVGQFPNREAFILADLCTKDMAEMIISNRFDYVSLHAVLTVIDEFLGESYLPRLVKELCEKFTDEELLSLTLRSKNNTLNYLKETIKVDVLISLLEGRALFKEHLDLNSFSLEIINIFHDVYPLKKNLLLSA